MNDEPFQVTPKDKYLEHIKEQKPIVIELDDAFPKIIECSNLYPGCDVEKCGDVELHLCPFRQEIEDDEDDQKALCRCCDVCREGCADDI